jgi:hypothetical protein
MENTGSYWKPLYNIFEQEGLPAMVCNAYHIKNVPGRKTDCRDFSKVATSKFGSWLSDIEGKSASQLLELVIGNPEFTLEDVKKRMHGGRYD